MMEHLLTEEDRLAGHTEQCPECGAHLTSLMLCPNCMKRYRRVSFLLETQDAPAAPSDLETQSVCVCGHVVERHGQGEGQDEGQGSDECHAPGCSCKHLRLVKPGVFYGVLREVEMGVVSTVVS